MIEVTGLCKNFGSVKALDNVSFKVEQGQIVGFLGSNGAGKTTTMDILTGCLGADQGDAKISGFDITENPIEAKRRLGYLPDEPPLHLEMQVDDYITYAAKLNQVPSSKIKNQVQKIIDRLDLGSVRSRLIGNLSKGFKQRVGLAQALVHDPEVLILDEPTEGLDPKQIAEIRTLIRELSGDHTILLSSHILSEVENTCDNLVIINSGKIVAQGTYNDIVGQKNSGPIYELTVEENAHKLADELEKFSGMGESTAMSGTSIRLVLGNNVNKSILDEVAKTTLDGGYGLRGLEFKPQSLEQVFFNLTKS